MSKTLFICICTVAILLSASCAGTQSASTAAITYNGQVKAIIDANCASTCHNATRPAAGIDLTTYEQVKNHALQGSLIPAIQHAEGVEAMPKKAPKLDDASIQVIVNWAAGGAVM